MCGIVGGVGKGNYHDFLLNGLSSLDYRGYDSAGVAIVNEGGIKAYKVVGTVEDLRKKTPEELNGFVGIGHTRWATHGAPTLNNAHPIVSMHKEFVIVHNGVIENFLSLRTKLLEEGYSFKGETDTEIVANYLEYSYHHSDSVLTAIKKLILRLRGSYALAIIHVKEPDKLYFAKKNSPLIIGEGKGMNYLASDAVPLLSYTDKFIDIDDLQYGFLTSSDIKILYKNDEVPKHYVTKNIELLKKELNGYESYMLKEIEETPAIISRLCTNYFNGTEFKFSKSLIRSLKSADTIIFLACGTSYHASLEGVRYMRYLGKTSEAYVASEWAYEPIIFGKKPLFILISQSGETADLIKCQKVINDYGFINVAITNTPGSSIDRESTHSLLLYAGLEVSVASTKAFSAQVALLAILVGAIENRFNVIDHLRTLMDALEKITAQKENIDLIAQKLLNYNLLFFIGRGNDLIAAKEACLKMKEITYIHSEAFPGGELKHGPIALVDHKTALIVFNCESMTNAAIRNNAKEVETRKGSIFIVSSEAVYRDGDVFSLPYVKPYIKVIPAVYFAQYLAYFVAKHKGVNIDKPRNLAKSVTVE